MDRLYIGWFNIQMRPEEHINAEFGPVLLLAIQVFMDHVAIAWARIRKNIFIPELPVCIGLNDHACAGRTVIGVKMIWVVPVFFQRILSQGVIQFIFFGTGQIQHLRYNGTVFIFIFRHKSVERFSGNRIQHDAPGKVNVEKRIAVVESSIVINDIHSAAAVAHADGSMTEQ